MCSLPWVAALSLALGDDVPSLSKLFVSSVASDGDSAGTELSPNCSDGSLDMHPLSRFAHMPVRSGAARAALRFVEQTLLASHAAPLARAIVIAQGLPVEASNLAAQG